MCYNAINTSKLYGLAMGRLDKVRLDTLDDIILTPQEATFVIEYCKDYALRRAAEASGVDPDTASEFKRRTGVTRAIDHLIGQRWSNSNIDAEWLLLELADNHLIARQQGNINASNAALALIAKHASVDAFAATKIEVAGDKEIVERLQRSRERLQAPVINDDENGESNHQWSFA
jgi:hypothetical protein